MKRLLIVSTSRAESGMLGLLADDLSLAGNFVVRYVQVHPKRNPILEPEQNRYSVIDFITDLTHSVCLTIMEFRPDAIIVLGDRYELLSVAQLAILYKIPIVHLHGGEVTRGAIDNHVRSAVSKLSSLHLVATDEFRQNLITMGENPDAIHVVGAFGIDLAARTELFSFEQVCDKVGNLEHLPLIVVTYHPETLSALAIVEQMTGLIESISDLSDKFFIVWTGSNADIGGATIDEIATKMLGEKVNVRFVDSLGHKLYMSACNVAYCVVGNSSSGLVEIPHFGTRVINIGYRQDGRPRSANVSDVGFDKRSILTAISSERRCSPAIPAYGLPGSCQLTVQVLRVWDFSLRG